MKIVLELVINFKCVQKYSANKNLLESYKNFQKVKRLLVTQRCITSSFRMLKNVQKNCSALSPTTNTTASRSVKRTILRIGGLLPLLGALDQSISWLSTKCVRTSRCAARSSTRCWRDGCSKSSASGRGGWQRGRYWRPLKQRCSCKTT